MVAVLGGAHHGRPKEWRVSRRGVRAARAGRENDEGAEGREESREGSAKGGAKEAETSRGSSDHGAGPAKRGHMGRAPGE
jgi:hypothetical protein